MKTYNKAVYMPKDRLLQFAEKSFDLVWGLHAVSESLSDKYGKIMQFTKLKTTIHNIVELSLNEVLEVSKLLVRVRYSGTHDVCYVVIPEGNKAFVKTCWLCRKDDTHKTLDRSQYQTK